jgi:hypothetical protein
MKVLSSFSLVVITAGISLFMVGCKKESLSPNGAPGASALITHDITKVDKQQERPLKGAFITSTTLTPDWEGGYNPYVDPGAPAWYPGSGEGNLTHLGLSVTLFNQHIIPTETDEAGNLTGAGTTPPVNNFFKAQLTSYGLTVPDAVGWIFLDKHVNSIWSKGTLKYWSTPENMWRIYLNGTMEIIGGTGRFAGTTGQYTVSGFSDVNVQTLKTSDSMTMEGFIVY